MSEHERCPECGGELKVKEEEGRRARAEQKAVAMLRRWENQVYLTEQQSRERLKELIAQTIMEQDCHTRYACASAALQMVRSYGKPASLETMACRVHEAVLQTKEGL